MCFKSGMNESSYYREQAVRARRLASAVTDQDARVKLEQLAANYSDIADDLEQGAADIRPATYCSQAAVIADEVYRNLGN